MPVRLLALGGSSYDERVRLGAWSVQSGALSDFYGIPPNEIAFGCGGGVFPFLIYRERLNYEVRGGYPYTVLLDPGDAWSKFGWSAALLLHSLMTNTAGLELLRAPEAFDARRLTRLLSELPPANPRPSEVATFASLVDLLAGSFVRHGMVTATLEDLGWSRRPRPEEVAALLEDPRIPGVFRRGHGWLIGGSTAQGVSFGSAVVVDDQASKPSEVAADWIAAGRRLRKSWEAARAKAPDEVLRLSEEASAWDENTEADLALLAKFGEPGATRDEVYEGIHDRHNPLLADAIRAVARKDIIASDRSPAKTRYILTHDPTDLELCQQYVDKETVGQWFFGQPPASIAAKITERQKLAIWTEWLGRVDRRAPERLLSAIGDAQNYTRELVEAAAKANLQLESFREWGAVRAHPAAGPHLLRLLSEMAAESRRKTDPLNWEVWHILFASPDDYKPLYKTLLMTHKSDLDRRRSQVDWLTRRIDGVLGELNGPFSPDALNVLETIGISNLRVMIAETSLELLDRIAGAVGSTGRDADVWARCRLLKTLTLSGSSTEHVPAAPATEVPYMVQEIIERLRRTARDVPQLWAIRDLLNGFPRNLAERLRQIAFSQPDPYVRERWSRAFSQVNLPPLAAFGIPAGRFIMTEPRETQSVAPQGNLPRATLPERPPISEKDLGKAVKQAAEGKDVTRFVESLLAAHVEPQTEWCRKNKDPLRKAWTYLAPDQQRSLIEWIAKDPESLAAIFGQELIDAARPEGSLESQLRPLAEFLLQNESILMGLSVKWFPPSAQSAAQVDQLRAALRTCAGRSS